MRAFTALWDRICLERYGVQDEKLRRFRYGVQVNSLGLTEAQPENNVQRIVLEMLGVTLSRDARARALQLPCWNEALGLPRPWDQQWSLRMQQVLAYETRPARVRRHLRRLEGHRGQGRRARATAAWDELQWVLDGGGAFEMIDEIKGRLVQSNAERVRQHRVGRDQGRRRELLHRDRAVAAHREPRRRVAHPRARPGGRGRADRAARGVAARARRRRGRARARSGCATPRRPTRT